MEILLGFFLLICFISLIIFGAHYAAIRMELEKKGIKLSPFFIWILPDLMEFRALITYEKKQEKKKDYLRMYHWSVYPLIIFLFCVVICFILFPV